jgi:hypothetical protein
MRMREELKVDITNLIDITEFGNEYDEDKTYQYLKSQIEIMFTAKGKDDYSLSLDNIVDLMNILNDSDNYTLRDSLFAMLEYLNKDSVGTNKIRVVAEQEEETFTKMVYTIEYGKIIEVDGVYERYCTNEVNFIDETTYKNYLVDILTSVIGNESELGYYIECYIDEEELTKKDLDSIKIFLTTEDCVSKTNMVQQFLIDNTGKCIDYVF